MATASIPASSVTRKRRPSPAQILQTYRQECITGGTRGAANRTATLLGTVSDDTVRRVVARDEAARKAREETPQELIFTPPDAAYEAERDAINRMHAAALAARRSPDVRQGYVKPERESGDFAATTPHDDAADRRSGERGNTPPREMLNAAAEGLHSPNSDEFDSQGDDVPLWVPDAEPGHTRPDVDEPGAEAPELPPENFPNPQPNQPPDAASDPRVWEPDIPREAIIVRQVVRVPEPRQVGGLVGWLSTNPMLGPVPVWALLLLAFGALLVQLGLLG